MISPSKIKSQLSGQTQWAMVNGLYSAQRSPRDCQGLYCDQLCSTTLSVPGGSSGSAQSLDLQKTELEKMLNVVKGNAATQWDLGKQEEWANGNFVKLTKVDVCLVDTVFDVV